MALNYKKILIKNGTVYNVPNKKTGVYDVLINSSKIEKVCKNIEDNEALVVDAKGKIVAPGLIDVHVHFRQPGQEYKEDLYSGSRAAAAGGFTTVIAEPNTSPPIDSPSRLTQLLKAAKKQSIVNFFSKSSTTVGLNGYRLIDVEKLKAAGAKAISDDGHPVSGKRLMCNALKKGKEYNILVNPHCEESGLYRKRQKEKRKSQRNFSNSVTSQPYAAEAHFVMRDIELAEKTGARIHISHVSLAKSVFEIAEAKKRGVKITAEVTPHHLLLSEEVVKEIGTNAKVNPPLRSRADVEAVRQGLADGTIDIIASDHAPHSVKEKDRPYNKAPFGLIGLETTLGLVLTYLVHPGILTLKQAIEQMTILPAKIFGLDKAGIGSITPGKKANIVIIDLKKRWKVDVNRFFSKARNSPFNGWKLQGKAIMTIVENRIVMKDGKIIETS
ncbi:MAG: dihydroorotase [Candidatus Brocadiaceae bacterium]|nr:dihydroorotase [Candidatus Brocadiaceae bacterium]